MTTVAYKPFVDYRPSPVRVGSPEAFVVSGGLALLSEAPSNSFPITVLVGGQPRTRVYTTPAAGQYLVLSQTTSNGTDYLCLLQFNAADEGASGTADYYGTGTILSAQFFAAFMGFMTPLLVNSVNDLPTPTTDKTQRGRRGDMGFTYDGQGYFSDGTSWTPFIVAGGAGTFINLASNYLNVLDAGYVGPSFADSIPALAAAFAESQDGAWQGLIDLVADATFGASFGMVEDTIGPTLSADETFAAALGIGIDSVQAEIAAQTFAATLGITEDATPGWADSVSLGATFGYSPDAFAGSGADITLAQTLGLTEDAVQAEVGSASYAQLLALAVDAVQAEISAATYGATFALTDDATLGWADSIPNLAATFGITDDAALDWAASLPNIAATHGMTEDAALDWAASLPNLAASFGLTEDGLLDFAVSPANIAATFAQTEDGVLDYAVSPANFATTQAITQDGSYSAGLLAVSDNFNRANGALGSNWSAPYLGVMPTISSNALIGGGGSNDCAAYWSANTFANNQYAELQTVVPTASGQKSPGPAVRISSSGSAKSKYFVYWVGNDDGKGGLANETLQLAKYVNGSFSTIGTAYTAAVGFTENVVRLEVSGTTLTVKTATSHGGTYNTRITVTDSSLSSGYPGISIGQALASSVACGDNWYGGEL